jgi:hypothetical protein
LLIVPDLLPLGAHLGAHEILVRRPAAALMSINFLEILRAIVLLRLGLDRSGPVG